MKRITSIFLLLLLFGAISRAEVVTLKSGRTVKGTVLMQNDEVLIIRDESGARFQFPAAEVVSVAEEAEAAEQEEAPQVKEAKTATSSRVALRFALNGGGTFVPAHKGGGGVGAELCIGSRYIAGRRVFLGGGVGVQADFLPDRKSIYVPVEVVVSMPLTQTTHAPEIGLGIGYGFSTHSTKGGLAAHFTMAWRYQFNERRALLLGARVAFQADEYPVKATEDGLEYGGAMGTNLIHVGLNLGVEF